MALLTLVSSKAVKRVEKIGLKEQFIMVRFLNSSLSVEYSGVLKFSTVPQREFRDFVQWYGGLRGAVCFALATTLDDSFELKQIYLTCTLVIIFFTVFIQVSQNRFSDAVWSSLQMAPSCQQVLRCLLSQGITIKPLVSLCRIKRKEEKMQTVASEFNSHVSSHSSHLLS